MEFKNIINRAVQIRDLYHKLEKQKYGRSWSREDIMHGFVGDVGDLSKLVLSKSGIREIPECDQKIAHELSDCLWSILILATKYDVDIEKEFLSTMEELESKINSSLVN